MEARERFQRAVISGVLRALDQEIMAYRNDPSRAFRVSYGRRVLQGTDGCFYAFNAETRLPIPPESPIYLQYGSESATGRLVAQSDLDILTYIRQDLGQSIPSGMMYCEPWFIYDKARAFVQEASQDMDDEAIPLRLMGFVSDDEPEVSLVPPPDLSYVIQPNAEQRASLQGCLRSSVHFVWGPPGTGKTANLAQTCRALVSGGERVLVLAHANVAVDRAMAQIARLFAESQEYQKCQIIRLGTPQLRAVRDDGRMNPEIILSKRQPELSRLKDLVARRDEMSNRILSASSVSGGRVHAELQSIRSQIQEIRKTLDEAMSALVSDARVIGTTLSRLAIDRRIRAFSPDAVLIDEASMAPFPLVLMASFGAKRRMGVFGDFRQLPPIHSGISRDVSQWLGRDTFEVAGVIEEGGGVGRRGRMTMLTEQYRMAQPICDLVSRLAYRGRIRPAEDVADRTAVLASMPPEPGQSLLMFDTAPLAPGCMLELSEGSYSRLNPVHAVIACAVAWQLASDGCQDIALITPYRIQARLLNGLIQAAGLSEVASASTVHRFQGSESDAVVFDLTDAPPQGSASRLTGEDADHALRLLNVALSRARGKLVVLADGKFVNEMHPTRSPARRMVNIIKDIGGYISLTGNEAERLIHAPFLTWYQNWDEAQKVVGITVADAKKAVHLNLPGFFPVGRKLHRSVTSVAGRLGDKVSIAAPMKTVIDFEESEASLSLIAREIGALGILDDEEVFFSARVPDAPVVLLRTLKLRALLQETLVGM